MVIFPIQNQKETKRIQINQLSGRQEMGPSFSELESLVNKLHAEKTELLQIALHLSQAVTRMGNSAIGIDSYDQHNEAVAIAQKCQEDLQDWIVKNVSRA